MTKQNEIDVLFVAGAPGAGKTTVTERYQAVHPGADQFGTGELVWGIRDGTIESEYAEHLRCAADSGVHLSGEDYGAVVRERILRAREISEIVMVTGFPHDRTDWAALLESIQGEANIVGAVVLNVSRATSIARMQARDIKRGLVAETVQSDRELAAYTARYHSLMARHALRLDCYRGSGLLTIPLSGEKPPDEVLANFDEAINTLKKGDRHDG